MNSFCTNGEYHLISTQWALFHFLSLSLSLTHFLYLSLFSPFLTFPVCLVHIIVAKIHREVLDLSSHYRLGDEGDRDRAGEAMLNRLSEMHPLCKIALNRMGKHFT